MSAELKRLAEAVVPVHNKQDRTKESFGAFMRSSAAFRKAASPDAILKILAERDELIKQLELAQMKTYLVQISDVAEQRDALCEALKDADIALARCEFVGAKAMDGGDGAIDIALVKVRAALALVGEQT